VGKLVLNSILIATIALPMFAARDRSPARGLRRAVVWVAAFDACYLVALLYVLPRLS
jgi:hypothetical protein